MKIKFNKFEKVAGLFVGIAIAGFIVGTVSIAIKKGWFSSRVSYFTVMESADGLHSGTTVQIAGLRAGAIDEVLLVSQNEVRVKFSILAEFSNQIRQDSVVQVFRPFIIGEKVLELTIGSTEAEVMAPKGEIPLRASIDIMDLLSGRKMNSFMGSFEKMTDSLRIFGEAFADPKRTQAFVTMFDRLNPLVKNLNTMSLQVSQLTTTALKKKRFERVIVNLAAMSDEMNKILPAFSREPEVGKQLGQLVGNLNSLTREMQKLTPAIGEIAPDLPRTTRRAVEALDETVVLLKAMQKSFLFRGKVKEVKEEENRLPASE